MSFGFSPGDIVLFSKLTVQAYQNWKNACGEYSEITGQLDSLQRILHRIDVEIKDPASLFSRRNGDYEDILEIMGKCRHTVSQLNVIVSDYTSLGNIVRSRRSNWDRLRLAHTEYKELGKKLTSQTTAISAYIDVVSASSLGRMEAKVDELVRLTNIIDKRASEMRAGKHEASIWSVHTNDDVETWRVFRRQLISEGFSSSTISRHKTVLVKHLKELNEKGLLDEQAPTVHLHTSEAMPAELSAIPEERYEAPSQSASKKQTDHLWENRAYRRPRYEKPTVSDDTEDSTPQNNAESSFIHGPSSNHKAGETTGSEEHVQTDDRAFVDSASTPRTEPTNNAQESRRQKERFEARTGEGVLPYPDSVPHAPAAGWESNQGRYGHVPYPDTSPYDPTNEQKFGSGSYQWHTPNPASQDEQNYYSTSPKLGGEHENYFPPINHERQQDYRASPPHPGAPNPTTAPEPSIYPSYTTKPDIPYTDYSSFASWSRIMWAETPKSELYPIKELPDLPEGWELYIDRNLRVVYIDTYSGLGNKKCFWTPPIRELYPDERTPHGWEKVTNIYGRIHWVDTTYGLVSYEHPLRTPAIIWDDPFTWRVWEGAHGDSDYLPSWWAKPLDRRKKGTFRLSDRSVPCQMTADVWEDGISDEAVLKRGKLFWGRSWDRQSRFPNRVRYTEGSRWAFLNATSKSTAAEN